MAKSIYRQEYWDLVARQAEEYECLKSSFSSLGSEMSSWIQDRLDRLYDRHARERDELKERLGTIKASWLRIQFLEDVKAKTILDITKKTKSEIEKIKREDRLYLRSKLRSNIKRANSKAMYSEKYENYEKKLLRIKKIRKRKRMQLKREMRRTKLDNI